MQTLKQTKTALITVPDFPRIQIARGTFASGSKPASSAIHVEALFHPSERDGKFKISLHPNKGGSGEIMSRISLESICQGMEDDRPHLDFLNAKNKDNIGYCIFNVQPESNGFQKPEDVFKALKANPAKYNVDAQTVSEAEAFYTQLTQKIEAARFIDLSDSEQRRRLSGGRAIS